MDRYIDKSFAILNGTLLSGIGINIRDLVIPAKIDGHPIRRIGNGCAIGRQTNSVILCEGIREFGKDAFQNCVELRSIEFPESLEQIDVCKSFINTSGPKASLDLEIILKRFFYKKEYDSLMKESIPLQSGEWLMGGDYMELPQFNGILNRIPLLKSAAGIRTEMGRLFVPRNPNNGCKQEQIVFRDGGEAVKAGAAFDFKDVAPQLIPIMIRERIPSFWNDNMERLGDLRMQQKDSHSVAAPNVLLTFLKSASEDNEGVHAVFRIRFGKAFFPSVVRLLHRGRAYYIYRIFYLTADKKDPYIRKDFPGFVFDAAGRVVKKPEVYAKYSFISTLA